MANTVAGLAVSLGLNATDYYQGLTKAEYEAKKFAASFERSMGQVRTGIKALGVGIVVNEIYALGKSVVSAASDLAAFSDQTGSSVESLSKLANQAQIIGTPFEELQNAVLKLSVNMGGAGKRSKDVEAVLKTLGVTARDPATAMQEIAVALAKYENGATKAAYAQLLFNQGGPKFLSTLGDMAKMQDVVGTTTRQQAEDAVKLEQAYNRLGAEATTFKNIVLTGVVPALIAAIEQMNEGIRIAGGFGAALLNFGTINPFKTIRENIEDTDKRIKNILAGGGSAEARWAQVLGTSDKLLAQLKQRREFLLFQERQRAMAGAGALGYLGDQASRAAERAQRLKVLSPRPDERSAKDKIDTDALAIAKRTLDSQLSAQEDFMRAEQSLLREREQFLQSYYRDDLISLENYYAGRQHAAEQQTQATIAAINKEIEAQRAFAKQAQAILAKDPEKQEASRIQTETAIAKLIAERGRVEHDAAVKTADAKGDLTRAQQQYTDSINETNAAVLQMMGNERKAAEIRLEIQNRSAIAKATLAGDAATVANIRALEKQALAQVDLNDAAREYQKTMEALSIVQARIALDEAAGNITTLEAMARRQQAVEKHIGQLREQIAIQERIAETLVGPAYDEAIAKIQRMKLEIDTLAASANELEDAFSKTFGDAFENNFASVIDGTKSVKQAFKSMADDILGDLARMAAKDIRQTLFGKGGAGSGLSSLLSGIFDYGGGGGAAIGATGPMPPMQGFAAGGYPPMGRISVVGERGPELFVPHTPGTIVPMNKAESMLRGNYVFNINVPAGATRSTIDQTRVKFGLELQNALDRGS